MKRSFLTLFIFAALSFAFYIESLDVTIDIQADGSILVKEQFDVAFAVMSDTPKGKELPKELVTSLELKKVDIVSRAIKVKEHKNKHYKGHERKYKFHK